MGTTNKGCKRRKYHENNPIHPITVSLYKDGALVARRNFDIGFDVGNGDKEDFLDKYPDCEIKIDSGGIDTFSIEDQKERALKIITDQDQWYTKRYGVSHNYLRDLRDTVAFLGVLKMDIERIDSGGAVL